MQIIDFDTLKTLFGGQTIEDVKVRMGQARVKYLVGNRGRPFTTIDAVNRAMGITSQDKNNDEPIFEIDIL